MSDAVRARVSSSSLGERFAQEEPITVRIRNILAEYPVSNLLKELLQNADDARATHVKLIIDQRSHPTARLVDPKLAAFQGPALLAFNNAPFTESDFANIRRLGASKKRADPGVTGRFGIGFNSVYHVTDLPSFISGTQVAFLDPHELVWSTRGVKFDLSSTLSDTCQTLFAQYSDQFAGFQTDTLRIDGAPVDGTLFRLPLRSVESRAQFPEISDDDTVSDVTWTTGDLEQLFAKFRQEAHLILLFLRSIEKIDLLIWREGHASPHVLFTAALAEISDADRALRRVIHDAANPIRRFSLNVAISAEDHVLHELYRVVTCSQDLSDEEAQAIGLSAKEQRKLIPWGGVATRVHSASSARDQSHVFCALPVTLSGLPVHVNGCFELSASRTALSWHEYARKDAWNRHVLARVVAPAYTALLIDCQALLSTAEYYALFPTPQHVLHDWERYVCAQLARVLHDAHVIRFQDTWIAPNKAIWPGLNVALGEALRTWLTTIYPLVDAPEHVMALCTHVTELQSLVLTPVTLITWLTGRDELLLALRTNAAAYNQLWQLIFTLPSEEYTTAHGIPLLFTESGTLVPLSAQTEPKYHVIRHARLRQVFAEIRASLIDVSLFTETVLSKLIEMRFMNARNVEHVTQLDAHIELLLPPLRNDCKVRARAANSFPSNEWLRGVWHYLVAENCDLSAYQRVPLIPVDGGTSLVPLERAAHVIDVSARDGDAVPVHVLRELQCHVLDADLQREIAQSRVTLCSAEPEHVIQLLWQLHGAQLGGKVTALSSEHKRDLRRYFVRTIKRQWHVTSQQHVILKQLAIFELVGTKNSERFVSLSQYTSRAPVQCHVLDVALPLIDCDKDETAFYDSIGLPQISVTELFRAHLFVGEQFAALSAHQQRELLQTLLKTSTLRTCDKEFLELVRNYPCIRCEDGKLRALSCTYDPDNRALCELLALSRTCCPEVVPLPEQWWAEQPAYLGGMRVLGFSHVLRVLDLRALCTALALMPGPLAAQFGGKLFRYVVSHFSELRAQSISLEFLRDSAWLPLYRPVSHVLPPFSELQDNICLVSPLSSQPRARQALVSAVLPLAHVDLPPRDHPFVQYVEWHLPISVSTLAQQLKAVAQLFLALPAKPSAAYVQDLEHVLCEIYGHVDEQLALSPDLAAVLQRNVSGTEHVIWTGTAFVAPNHVALRCTVQIKPWLMKVPKFVAQFKHLTQHVGFMIEFGAEHYCRVLSDLHAQYGGTPLSAAHLKHVLKIVRHLSAEIARHGADHVPLDHVLVPNSAAVLKSARTVMYQSRDSAQVGGTQFTHDLVHAEIAPECCRVLGIAPADKLLLQTCVKPFGQRQELVHRLQSVLHDYPAASLVLELLQNADDAGATQFRVEYDAEQYPSTQLALPLHALLSSAALVFYNDAPFTEADLSALAVISRGSKQDRADQIGRYGLGFNSVYNVTDAPMVLSRDKLLVLDPQLAHLRGWASDQEPGVCIDFTAPNNHVLNADLLAPFKHLGVDPTRPFSGTIIRLPLRTKRSKLSATVCTEEHVTDLFRQFSALGTAPMLFLQHVEQVRVVSRDKSGETLHVQHSVEVNSPTHSRALLAHYVQSEGGGMVAHRLQVHTTRAALSSHHRATEHEEWLVCHHCAMTASGAHVTGKLPLGGVAHCLSDHDKSRAGPLFCFLPLPMHVSLPMFVNGYFQLTTARTSLAAHDTWNEALRDGPIFACYWHVMLNLRKDSPAAYWSVFPQSTHDSKDFWNPLVARVYQQLAREPSLFVMETHRLIEPRAAIFYQGYEQSRDHVLDDALRNYLLDVLHVPLVTCPRHVLEEFKRVGVEIAIFSPKVLRTFLKQHVTQLEHCAESLQVLQYCLEDVKAASATDLLDLPLLPVKSRALVRFSAASPCILVHSLNEYELFPPNLHARLVDLEAIPRNLVQISRPEMGIVPLSLELLLDHVPHILPATYQGQHVVTDPAPRVLQWLVYFWHWIRRQCATAPHSVNGVDACAALIDSLCARLAEWPVVPTVSGQLVSPNTPLFYQGSLPAEHFEVALAQRLGCHFVDAQHYHVPAEFTQRLYAPNMANILDYTKKRPEVIDRFSELSPLERDRALSLVAQCSDGAVDDHCALIRRLPLFPLVHELPQRLTDLALLAAANYSRAQMAPELWTQTRDALNTCFYTAVIVPLRASAVVLLRDQRLPPVPLHTAVPFMKPLHGALYKRLGIRAVRTADYLTNHVLPHLAELDDPNMVFQYMAEHWLTLREFAPLVTAMSRLPFVAHGTGTPICARDLYDPAHVIYRILFADEPEVFPAEPHASITWLQMLRDLGMHVTPSGEEVGRAAQLLAEQLSYDHSDPQLLQTLQSFWAFALEEKLLQSLPQLSSLKLVVAQWDHRQRPFEGGITRLVVPLRDVGFDFERELLWTQRPLIDGAVFGSTLVNELFAQHRATDQHVTPLDCHVVFTHLDALLDHVRDKSRASVCDNVLVHEHVVRQYELDKTLHEIWRFMNHAIDELSAELIARLQSLPWLLISHQSCAYLVPPRNIFANVLSRLAPLWFELPNLYTTNELAAHVTRGVEPSANDARAALRQLHESRIRIVAQSPEGDTAHVTVELVLELMRLAATATEPDLEVPVLSEDHVLVPINHVFIHDKHVAQYRVDATVKFLHSEVPRDLGLALGVQPFSHIIDERVVSHVLLDEGVPCSDDELLQSHRELREIVARTRSPIFADVLALILRAQSSSSELSVTHSVNQLKRLRVVFCSEISTQLIDRRNNAPLSQARAKVAMVVQHEELFVARKPSFVRWSDLLAQQLNKFLNFPLRDLLAVSAVLDCNER